MKLKIMKLLMMEGTTEKLTFMSTYYVQGRFSMVLVHVEIEIQICIFS